MKARSRIAGHYYFTNRMDDYSKGSPTPNGPFHTECKALRRVVSSAAESETGGAFENAQHLIPIKYICEKIFNHPQPKDGSPLITDNSTSHGIATRLIKPRRSKTWDTTGSKIALLRKKFNSFGNRVRQIEATISQNIILLVIIA